MKQKNNSIDRDPSGQPLLLNEASGTETELHIFEWLVKGFQWEPQNIPGYCQVYRLPSQTDGKAQALKKTPT